MRIEVGDGAEPLSDSDLHSIAFLFGEGTALEAFAMVDGGQVIRIAAHDDPVGRSVVQITETSGRAVLCLPAQDFCWCGMPRCAHLLAAALAVRTQRITNRWVDADALTALIVAAMPEADTSREPAPAGTRARADIATQK
nr:hypothetical protein HK105_006749 [Polyrhizophydium stewartii]